MFFFFHSYIEWCIYFTSTFTWRWEQKKTIKIKKIIKEQLIEFKNKIYIKWNGISRKKIFSKPLQFLMNESYKIFLVVLFSDKHNFNFFSHINTSNINVFWRIHDLIFYLFIFVIFFSVQIYVRSYIHFDLWTKFHGFQSLFFLNEKQN